jgi:hypothetical protein
MVNNDSCLAFVTGRNMEREYYIELSGLSPFLVGRICVLPQGNLFTTEVDIVQSESGKIYSHVTTLFNQEDERESVDLAVHHLKQFLDSKKK